MHCAPCTQRDKWLPHPDRTLTRQVVFFKDRSQSVKQNYTSKMKQKIDTPEGRSNTADDRRAGVCHITSSIGLKRFSLRLGEGEYPVEVVLYCA